MRSFQALAAFSTVVLCNLSIGAAPARAYSEFGLGCNAAGCHDFFAGNPDMHDVHRNQIMVQTNPARCQLCHTQSSGNEGPPVQTFRSLGGLPAPGPSNLGCAGCHGNDYGQVSRTDGLPKATAKGLRKHHAGLGITLCAGCHAADDAGTILGENVPPPYYQRADVVPKDPCNADGNEGRFFAPVNRGLDNDGDGLWDMADPDCTAVPSGACCNGIVCSVVTQASCAAGGGTYRGDGTPCNASICAACTVPPGTIHLLHAVKEPNRTDAAFSWDIDPTSAAYRVYSVSRRLDLVPPPLGGGPPRGSNPLATQRCSTANASTLTCTHVGATSVAAGSTLFYQVVGVCNGDASIEGPN